MIVKNEADVLRLCLESVQGLVSQMVIADTGSRDGTVNVAREFGATVLDVTWENHFAKARNRALEPLTTDWVLVLDADEELDPHSKPLVPTLLDEAPEDVGGYTITIRDYMRGKFSYFHENQAAPNDCEMERARTAQSYHKQKNIRLFRRTPEIYFFGRVHELIEYRLCALGLKFPETDVLIHHFGYLQTASPEAKARKGELYRSLLHLKVKEEADNPMAWFELGQLEQNTFQNYDFAFSCFQKAVRLYPDFTRARLYMAEVNLARHRPEEAMLALEKAEGSEEAVFLRQRLKGDALHDLGRLPEARLAYQTALDQRNDDPLVLSRLGYVEVKLGETEIGLQKLKGAVESAPEHAETHDLLIKAYVAAHDLRAAADAAERFAGCLGHPKIFLRAASIRAHLGERERCEALLRLGLQLFPESGELRRACVEAEEKSGKMSAPTISKA